MAGKARLRGQSPAQEALMRPGAKRKGGRGRATELRPKTWT